MADRTVKVTLRAEVANYLAGMEKAHKATRETGTEAEKLAQKKEAFERLGRTALVMGSVIAAGVGLAVARFAEFDAAMSNVLAVTQETDENMRMLRQAALDFGASSVFTAKEAANAIEELGKAGLSTSDILGGALEGSLNLASAGELGIARAAEIAATTLQQFGLDGSQAARVADTLAAGAGKAMGSVDDLANGLKFVGPIAASMGISLEETTGVLALFAQQGIIGEQAGTSLRGMLSSLTSPSKAAQKEIEALGIKLYDQRGRFLGLENAAGQLSKAYRGMTDEQRDMSLGMLFGNQQITAARVLYKDGSSGVREWTAAVKDSGYAAQVARDRLDNLQGDVEQLGGAFDTALITTGSAANDVLRAMTQALTNVIDLYNDAPEPVKVATLAIGGIAAATLLASGAFFLVVPKVQQFNAALAMLGPNAQKVGTLLTAAAGPIAAAFAAAGVAIAIFAGRQADAKAKTEAFSDTLDQQTGKVQDSTRELVKANLATKGSFLGVETGADSVFDAAKKVGLSLEVVTDAAMGSTEALELVRDRLAEIEGMDGDQLSKTFGKDWVLAEAKARQVADAVKGESESLEEAIRVTKQKASIDGEAAKKAEVHAVALGMLEGKAESAGEEISDLAEIIRGFGSAVLSTRDAERQFEAAIDDATEALKDHGKTLDIGTEKGRANEKALDDIAKASLELAAARLEETGSQEAATAAIESGREALRLQLAAFGITGDAAEAYIDRLGLIPENVTTAVTLTTGEAESALNGWITAQSGRRIRLGVDLYGGMTFQFDPSKLGLVARAEGGILPGAPSSRDNMLIAAASGEFVVNAAATVRNRALLEAINSGRGYADGGYVQPRYAAPSFASSGSAGGAPASVSLAGATLVAEMDGVPFRLMIRDQIVSNERQQLGRAFAAKGGGH